jgi:hypothetical protein
VVFQRFCFSGGGYGFHIGEFEEVFSIHRKEIEKI